MLVSAVRTNVYSYSTYNQNMLFGANISDVDLQLLFEKYGILPTGDSQADLQALYNAMYPEAQAIANASQASSSTQSQASQSQQSTTNVSWANLMNQMDIETTGNLAKDYSAFSKKISAMKVSATTSQDKATISMLEAQTRVVFVQQDQSVIGTSLPQSEIQKPSASGADIQAVLNKLFLLG